jgi:hypothetical protein
MASSASSVTASSIVNPPVAVRRSAPEADRCRVALVGIEQKLGKSRRRTEADRQKSRRERIERARVAGLCRIEEALDAGERPVRRDSRRLVEQQHAVDIAPRRTARCGHRDRLRQRIEKAGSTTAIAFEDLGQALVCRVLAVFRDRLIDQP